MSQRHSGRLRSCTAPIAIVTAAWVGSITGRPERRLEVRAILGHAGAAQHQDVGAVLVAQPRADLAHAREGALPVGELDHAEPERQFARKARRQTQLAHVAQMAGERGLENRDDAEALAAGQRGQQAAFGDPEHRPRGRSPGRRAGPDR